VVDVPETLHSQRERGRVTAQDRRTDNNGCTLLVIHEADGSWAIQGRRESARSHNGAANESTRRKRENVVSVEKALQSGGGPLMWIVAHARRKRP
jgi:hypothetical protein